MRVLQFAPGWGTLAGILAAGGAAAVSAGMLLGWLVQAQTPWFLHFPGTSEALSVIVVDTVAGLALLFHRGLVPWARRAVLGGAGCLMAVAGGLSVAETMLHGLAGADVAVLHAVVEGVNAYRGGASPLEGLALLCLGLALTSFAMPASVRTRVAALVGMGGAVAFGLAGLLPYAIGVKPLEILPNELGMAAASAFVLTLLAFSTFATWRRVHARELKALSDFQKISLVSTSVLMVVALLAGLTSLMLMQRQVDVAHEARIRELLTGRQRVIADDLQAHIRLAQVLAAPLAAQAIEGRLAPRDGGPQTVTRVPALFQQLLGPEGSSVRYLGHDGKATVLLGQPVNAGSTAVLVSASVPSEVFWARGRYYLQTRQSILGQDGVLEIQQPLAKLGQWLTPDLSWSKAAALALCGMHAGQLTCLPGPRQAPLGIGARRARGRLAAGGQGGVTITAAYSDASAIMAYAPMGDTGLGLAMTVAAKDLNGTGLVAMARSMIVVLSWVGLGAWPRVAATSRFPASGAPPASPGGGAGRGCRAASAWRPESAAGHRPGPKLGTWGQP